MSHEDVEDTSPGKEEEAVRSELRSQDKSTVCISAVRKITLECSTDGTARPNAARKRL